MTPREFSGWVPAERHVHYDVDGSPTGYTVVERESRIDDADRIELLALARHDAETGPCGFHPSIAEDDANDFTPATHKCPLCEALDVQRRVLAEQDKASQDWAPEKPRPGDGRHLYMRLMTPQQAQAARERAEAKGGRQQVLQRLPDGEASR